MTKDKALELALYALNAYRPVIVKRKGLTYSLGDKAITAIKEALAHKEPEQEPVIDQSAAVRIATALGWTPQRKPLTDEEIEKMRHLIDWTAAWSYINFARAIEAAHNIFGDEK